MYRSSEFFSSHFEKLREVSKTQRKSFFIRFLKIAIYLLSNFKIFSISSIVCDEMTQFFVKIFFDKFLPIKAFKLNSIDYLLKPIDPDELTPKQALEALYRVKSLI